MINILYLHAGAEMYGSDKVLLQLVTKLNKKKFRPIVLLPEHGILENKLKENNVKVSIIPYPILRREYLTFHGILNYIFNYFKYGFRLKKYVQDKNIDLIHINTIAVLEGVFLKLFTTVPVVWHIHEILTNPKFIYKLTSYLVGKFSDIVIAISNATKENLVNSGFVPESKVKIVYNGIDLSQNLQVTNLRNHLNIKKTDIVIGHVGRINAWKGQNDFLEASIPVMIRHPNVHILFSGNPYKGQEWREKNLLNRINALYDLKTRIHYLGYEKRIDKVFETIDIFVSCSTRPEPFSLVTIEAMKHYKPVIAYDKGGPSEIIRNGYSGILVPFLNVNSLSEAIESLVNDPNKIVFYGINSRRIIKNNFSEVAFVKNIENIYGRMIS